MIVLRVIGFYSHTASLLRRRAPLYNLNNLGVPFKFSAIAPSCFLDNQLYNKRDWDTECPIRYSKESTAANVRQPEPNTSDKHRGTVRAQRVRSDGASCPIVWDVPTYSCWLLVAVSVRHTYQLTKLLVYTLRMNEMVACDGVCTVYIGCFSGCSVEYSL